MFKFLKKSILILILKSNFVYIVFSQQIKVGLFDEFNTQAIIFSVAKGYYMMLADGRAIQSLKLYDNILIYAEKDSINCYSSNVFLGKFKYLKFQATVDSSVFSIRPINPLLPHRYYDDNLILFVKLGKLQTVNEIDIDKYVSGVVEAEGGTRAGIEYYKTQALLCRTYALSHVDRHIEEGFHLCDNTHCQVYKGKVTSNAIERATLETSNQVIIDQDSALIISAFHSNCGGITENAENVWLIKKNYLVSVRDPYCLNMRNAKWQFTISLEEWKKYLQSNGFQINSNMSSNLFNQTQYTRKQFYRIKNDSVSYQKLRRDFKLKSTFFSVEVKGGEVILSGRGYGHGVGLCQEGAMNMAMLGYTYKDIILFYYRNISIVDFHILNHRKNQQLRWLYP